MLETTHQCIDGSCRARLARILFQPFAKCGVESLMLSPRHEAGLLDKAFVGTEGYIFHTQIVYTILVYESSV